MARGEAGYRASEGGDEKRLGWEEGRRVERAWTLDGAIGSLWSSSVNLTIIFNVSLFLPRTITWPVAADQVAHQEPPIL